MLIWHHKVTKNQRDAQFFKHNIYQLFRRFSIPPTGSSFAINILFIVNYKLKLYIKHSSVERTTRRCKDVSKGCENGTLPLTRVKFAQFYNICLLLFVSVKSFFCTFVHVFTLQEQQGRGEDTDMLRFYKIITKKTK